MRNMSIDSIKFVEHEFARLDFKHLNPSFFTIKDFFDLVENKYVRCVCTDKIQRCGNILSESYEPVFPAIKFEDSGVVYFTQMTFTKCFRFITVCKLFILHQIEWSQEIDGKRIYIDFNNIEYVNSEVLQERFIKAMELVADNKIVTQRIENLENKNRYLSRSEWMHIFSYSLISMRVVYRILNITEEGNIFDEKIEKECGGVMCLVCVQSKGKRVGCMLEEELINGEIYVTRKVTDILVRQLEIDTYFKVYWPVQHNKLELNEDGVYHHYWDEYEHGHYRIPQVDMTTIKNQNVELDIGVLGLALVRFVCMVMKKTVRDKFVFGLQYYALYP